ncbi:MAG TPA: hypothetical protein VGW38_25240, partial [Chloroflexota bacterium]|nr:hypothetical protein [Chloroflexota bacterium]
MLSETLTAPEPNITDVTATQEAETSTSGVMGHTAETEALFAQLFEQYEQAIYQYVLRMLGDPEDAR